MAMAGEASAMDVEMPMRTMHLEREYEKTLLDSVRLLDTEKDRVRRMELLFLRFENEALRSQLEEANGHLLGFSNSDSEACAQLQEACQEIDRLELEAQTSSGEIDRLKSELERLSVQAASTQTIIAEKHEMERLISSLEVQFANERHAHERTQARASQQTTEISKLAAQVEGLRNELAGESRAKQQQEREYHHQNSAWETQRATLEGKIDSLKQQLRSTKDKFQEVQNELLERRSLKQYPGNDYESSSRTVPLQRPGPSGHANVTIATPGAVRIQDNSKKDSAVPGDKSVFSITPFLNRTGAPVDSPLSSVGYEDENLGDTDDTYELLGNRATLGESKRIGSALRRQISLSDDRNPIKKAPKPRAGAREGAMAVSVSANEVKKPNNRLDRKGQPTETDKSQWQLESEQTKPKKRKLGGQRDRSLFEEEEEEEPQLNVKFGRKHAISSGRAPNMGSKQQPSSSTTLPRTLGFGAPMGFSPLKKDRKRIQ
ncbi:hypothetical protein N7457_003968 [Penicillium paradoxum]|uniref:uncharacterized protein n=1 Tax=Penicillium paradoxum TaxID=176176 RepID=UPI0025496D8E|nr:uncharacterized protein N7457_003968 [Penicillium paradoxum]KAJ5782194.1 hypothetical protein N7457_003968 [Penicillium paradoxum]